MSATLDFGIDDLRGAAHLLRPVARLLVCGRGTEKSKACAADLGRFLGVEAEVVEDLSRLVMSSMAPRPAARLTSS